MDRGIVYLEAFKKTKADAVDSYQLHGDHLLVEKLDQREMLPKSAIEIVDGGRQINTMSASKPVFARVLLVGEGYYDEDEDGKETITPCDVEEGDIILVGQNSIGQFSSFGKLNTYGKLEIGITRATEIMLKWRGSEGFDEFFKVLLDSVENSK